MIEREIPPRMDAQERWAKTRQRGLRSYIIRVGIAGVGLLNFIVRLLVKLFFVWRGAEWNPVAELVSFLIGALVIGTFMGWWMWRSMERRFGPKAQPRSTPSI